MQVAWHGTNEAPMKSPPMSEDMAGSLLSALSGAAYLLMTNT